MVREQIGDADFVGWKMRLRRASHQMTREADIRPRTPRFARVNAINSSTRALRSCPQLAAARTFHADLVRAFQYGAASRA